MPSFDSNPVESLDDRRSKRLHAQRILLDALETAERQLVIDLYELHDVKHVSSRYQDAGTWDYNAELKLYNDLKRITDAVCGLVYRLARENDDTTTHTALRKVG